MKVCIVGAGSPYTPELLEKFAEVKEEFPVGEIALYDIDQKRLAIMEGFARRYCAAIGLENIKIHAAKSLAEAVSGADFVNTQIRVGGNLSRVRDERIPLSHGFIGQETTGPGGFMKALRTVPQMLDIAKTIEREAPDAWLINYTNPTGIVGQALSDYSKVKFTALCAGGIRTQWRCAEALGVDADDVRYDIFGLNHLNYAYNITVRGRKLTDEEFEKVVRNVSEVNPEVGLRVGAVLSGYLQYYYHRTKKLDALTSAPQTRGEIVLGMERELYDEFADPASHEKPKTLKKRGGGGYSAVAVRVMNAIWNNRDTWCVTNLANNGTFRMLPDRAVIETAVLINASGIRPLAAAQPPKAAWGLVAAVKAYEMMTAEAAVTGDRDLALMALTHHPLVCDYDQAKILLDEMLEANRAYLPAFFR